MSLNFKEIEALIIDMDGVLWLEGQPLPGIETLFAFLEEQQMPFMLATNNARRTPDQYQKRLAEIKVNVEVKHILSSPLATAAYLEQELSAGDKVFVVGEAGLRQAMRDIGLIIVEDSSEAVEAVVAGLDFEITYEKLKHAALLIQRGARFIGSNADPSYPVVEGRAPGAGSILAAIQTATGVSPTVIGKPERSMFDVAIKKMGTDRHRTAMIGDRLDTDILGGQRAGLKTILITTGVDNAESVTEKEIEPDAILDSLDDLVARLRGN